MGNAPKSKPRGTYFEKTEERVREAMHHALDRPDGEPVPSRAYSIAATAVAPLLGLSTYESRRLLERLRYLLDAGEIAPDLLRRMNPNTGSR